MRERNSLFVESVVKHQNGLPGEVVDPRPWRYLRDVALGDMV